MPIIKIPEPPKTIITKFAFKQRLTQTERIAIREAAAVNPIVYDFEDLLNSAQFVDLTFPDTIAGVQQLEAAGLLTEGRANEILTAPVQPFEEVSG